MDDLSAVGAARSQAFGRLYLTQSAGVEDLGSLRAVPGSAVELQDTVQGSMSDLWSSGAATFPDGRTYSLLTHAPR